MVKDNKAREPLIHITKRTDIDSKTKFIIRASAVVGSLLLSAILVWIVVGSSPLDFLQSLIQGPMFNSKWAFQDRKLFTFLYNVAILLCISLAVAPAFKMKFWNIGADGQTLVGCLASVICLQYLNLPDFLLVPIMLVASMLAGALWAVIPALCKAKWNTNETLFTLMMNYVATQLTLFFIGVWAKDGSGILKPYKLADGSYKGMLPTIGKEYYYTSVILIVVFVTAFIAVYMKQSKHGYEISVVGESENTARYIGIDVKKVIIRTMLLSGVICGLAGFLIISGYEHTMTADTVAGRGFTAILVAWLAKFNPVFMVLTASLVIFMQTGTQQFARSVNITNSALSDIVTGIVFLAIIASEFFIEYDVHIRGLDKKEAKI